MKEQAGVEELATQKSEYEIFKNRENELIDELDRMQQENHILAAVNIDLTENINRLKRLDENVNKRKAQLIELLKISSSPWHFQWSCELQVLESLDK